MNKPTKTQIIENWFSMNKVTKDDLADLAYNLQSQHIDIQPVQAYNAVIKVMSKREVKHALITAITLDELAQFKNLPEPLQSIVQEDRGTYGIDENLAIGVANLYGSIGTSAFGYLDNNKQGIIKELNDKQKTGGVVTTFMDDMLSAIVAAANGYLAHKYDEGH